MFNKILSKEKKEGSFEHNFYEFMCERQENNREISTEVNKRQDDLLSQIVKLQKQIQELLPENSKNIILEISSLGAQLSSIDMDLSYTQGFRDGMKMQLLAVGQEA